MPSLPLHTQVLVDWHPFTLYRGWFFAYFLLTWVMLNIWAIWGVSYMWPMTSAIGTVAIVNIQTILMFMFYVRCAPRHPRHPCMHALNPSHA